MGFKQKFLMFLRHQLCYQWRLYQNYLGTFMWIVAIHIFLIYYSRFSPFLPSSPFPAFLVAANWISNTQEVSSSAQKCGNWKISVSSFSEVLLSELLSPSCLTLCHPMDYTWNSPGQNSGLGSLSLPQRIFPTQGLNPGLLDSRHILYHLRYQGSPRLTYSSLNELSWKWNRVPWTDIKEDILYPLSILIQCKQLYF